MRALFIIPLFLLSLISFHSWANDDETVSFAKWNKWAETNDTPLEGEMNCKITDQIILFTEEGKPKRYSNQKDSPKIGDSLTLNYNASERNIVFTFGNS